VTDEELHAEQRRAVLRTKAMAAVKSRKWTDKPGGDWHLNEVGAPIHNGVSNHAAIYPNEDGSGYEVIIYTYAGAEVTRRTWKGLDVAFRKGQALTA
jgi:hypothetical protein